MRPSLSSAEECIAVHVWAQSSLPGCVCAVMMSVVSVRRAAARRYRCVGAAACAPAASASGAASKAGCRGALSLSGGGLEREGCIQASSFLRGGWKKAYMPIDANHYHYRVATHSLGP